MCNLTKLTDEQLVAAYADGDNLAFDTLLMRYRQRLFSYIFQMVRDRDLADDIFQETFIKAITTIRQGRYNDMGKFSAWLYRIARNLVVDTFRSEKAECAISTDDVDYNLLNRKDLAEDNIEDALVDIQIEQDLHRLVSLLPDEQRTVVDMRFYRDLSFKEIAEQTGVSINTALGRMRYALINLRKMIKEKNLILS